MGQSMIWKKATIYVSTIGFLLMITLLITGCQIKQPLFSTTAGNIGSAFAAAETTLLYAHEGKITYAYADSSFANFQSELSGADQTIAASQGVPSASILRQLLSLYQNAMRAVNTPCLSDSCNWRVQLSMLDRASKAFLKAGNS